MTACLIVKGEIVRREEIQLPQTTQTQFKQ